ncbi:uncharacterized protein A1O9_05234 [Exophiala aquamarina CBS 119918]|uniref:Carbohydrate kinase PfkB domain-containing protein n=1 Tax=Exophiala aquamarina CBS 119918 TaxID=1182545 RepID=A0A072PC47_9EURO|nr:uncharacterized protein A1O9_05234 [Exophiala aquamarina CBS 119918]KEF57317.1 hypothetical protein A1O9_05234 [Exophiala aquamarina CBS 119918]
MTDPKDRLGFCTLGMFIIGSVPLDASDPTLTITPDEIEHPNSDTPEQRIIGGAGTYAALGARLAAGGHHARHVGWIVDMGSDFPAELRDLIETWNTKCVFRLDMDRLTTTAWNGYGHNEHRGRGEAFKYLTPKLRLDELSLSDEQLLARSFHMVCSPQRCMSLINGIMARRKAIAPGESRPVFVWEPIPDLCTPEEFDRLRSAIALVDVVSPNAEELASFFPVSTGGKLPQEIMAEKLLLLDSNHYMTAALVVREGAFGCTTYVGRRKLHLRAFHQDGSRIRDPTGGGNTFLGALAMGMTGCVTPVETSIHNCSLSSDGNLHRYLHLGLLHATVAAAYAIEQVGMPNVSTTNPDRWNGESYQDRFKSYLDRQGNYIAKQIH